MGYCLLWIETLAVSLLFVAWLTACVARWRSKWLRGLVWMLPTGLLFLMYLVPITVIGVSIYYKPSPTVGLRLPGLYPLTALTLCFLVGIIVLRRKGFRRIEGEMPAMAASSWPRAKIFAGWLVAVALQSMTFWNLDLEACQKLAVIQTEMSAMALSLEPANIPRSENAAPIYERAAEALNSKDTTPKDWEVWICGLLEEPPKLDVKDEKVAEFFRRKQGVVELLHEAARKPGCLFEHVNREYWPPDFEKMDLQMHGMRQFARFLACHALWQSANGNPREATQDIDGIYALARHECEEPLMITQLVGIAIDNMATDTLQKILNSARPTAEDLDQLKIDRWTSYQKMMQKEIRRESLIGWSFLSQFSGSKMPKLQLDRKTSPVLENPAWTQSIYRVFLLQSEISAMRDIYDELHRVAALPYYQFKKDGHDKKLEDSVREKTGGPCSMMLGLLIPAMNASLSAAARGDATHNTAVLALAISRYRLKNGHFPAKLGELVPDFLIAVPGDPFDGKTMKYKRTEQGAVIYSIGPDLVDDGGKPLDDKNRKGDVRFKLLERNEQAEGK
jgi:hypothetical protein